MLKKIFFIFLVLMLNLHIVVAAENEYGTVKAWFNCKNATVEDVKLKIGEPANIDVTISSKISGDVFVELKEVGVTNAFDVVSGPSKIGEYIDNYDIASEWSKTYTWTIAPNGAWKNGNAPINIFVSFSKKGNQKPIQFTIANPYILDEQYTGAPSNPTPQPTASGTPAKSAPFPSVVIAVVMLLVAWRWMKH